jgi:hypothetical protein
MRRNGGLRCVDDWLNMRPHHNQSPVTAMIPIKNVQARHSKLTSCSQWYLAEPLKIDADAIDRATGSSNEAKNGPLSDGLAVFDQDTSTAATYSNEITAPCDDAISRCHNG